MKKITHNIISVIIWIALWQIAAIIINKPIFLPSPVDTIKALFSLVSTTGFIKSIGFSLFGITRGFIFGIIAGALLVLIASSNQFMDSFISIPVKIIKSIPVASFIILALLWVDAKNLATLVSAMLVTPIFFENVFTAVKNTDKKMLDMAKVFKLSYFNKIKYIYLPSVKPAILSSSKLATGFAFKSGVAAEVIGLVSHSIGNNIYQSKLYFETDKLFAWTIVLLIMSFIFEKLFVLIIRGLMHDKTK